MKKFELKYTNIDDRLIIEITGSIDENAHLDQCDLSLSSGIIELDLSNVITINSCGIREWIRWLSKPNYKKIILKKCPKVIVDQMNMVEEFIPVRCEIESFFVPYFSDQSGEEKSVLLVKGIDFETDKILLPKDVKDSFGQIMDLDILENKYFKFLKKIS